MKMSTCRSNSLVLAALSLLIVFPTGCSGKGKVEGSTYIDNGGVVQIEFKKGGKAYVSTGPVSNTCSYSENGSKLSLVCDNDKTDFTIDEDGELNGPPGGLLGHLTKKK